MRARDVIAASGDESHLGREVLSRNAEVTRVWSHRVLPLVSQSSCYLCNGAHIKYTYDCTHTHTLPSCPHSISVPTLPFQTPQAPPYREDCVGLSNPSQTRLLAGLGRRGGAKVDGDGGGGGSEAVCSISQLFRCGRRGLSA